jgi:hypothetical protein
MAHGNGLCKIFVQTKRPADGSGDFRHLKGMGEARAVMVA